VPPARGHPGERRSRGDAEQLPLGIELVEDREEVGLVGGPAVKEHQGALRLARRLADQMGQLVAGHPLRPGAGLERDVCRQAGTRGFEIGLSWGSTFSRRCS
jgi:hypothetical protein